MWLKLCKSFFNFDKDIYIAVVYTCPTNSSYAKNCENLYELLEEDICKFTKKGECLLTEDFNTRTATEPDFCTNDDIGTFLDSTLPYEQDNPLLRSNTDKKQVDINGEKLLNLCKTTGLRIINGRFLGDLSGYFTCHNHVGNPSVIDYMIATPAILNCIDTFYVRDPSEFSIHSLLTLRLKAKYLLLIGPSKYYDRNLLI